MSGPAKIGCKRCHGPVGKPGQHLGSRTGNDHCTLPHDPSCPGEVLEVPEKIASCPVGYVLGMEFPESAVEATGERIPKADKEVGEDSDSDDSQTSFSTQKSDDLESETNGIETDVEPTSKIPLLKFNDQGLPGMFGLGLGHLSMMNGQTQFTTGSQIPGTQTCTCSINTRNAPSLYTASSLSGGGLTSASQQLPHCATSTVSAFASTSSPVNSTQSLAPPEKDNVVSGGYDAQALMSFIQQQMTDMRFQMGNEINQALA